MGIFSFLSKKKQQAAAPGTVYEAIGGEPAVKAIANDFYNVMEHDPFASELLAIHPMPLTRIRHVFFLYLKMWMGGPNDFEQQFGHPRLRARHLPFTVTPALKAQWMYCMRKAMMKNVSDIKLANRLLVALDSLAEHMINQPDDK
ncbi:group II truncated hemoglobin [Salinimonas chungwhensis]|uniref:group II truncated hemoglobin n=1 Tax=Salinimonas chungwhensis TaxID=265425 RepID=UPI0003816717|nr:group II truncated hemoglobin [Salinimonas chungwhensis]